MSLAEIMQAVEELKKHGFKVLSGKEWQTLTDDSLKYQALVEYGVDNWSGFEDAMQSLECSESEDEE